MTVGAKLPPSNGTKAIEFKEFKGADFESEIGAVSLSRSPDCLIMISDQSGRPVKRFGYEKLLQLQGRINGIFRLSHLNDKKEREEKRLIHSGDKLYLWKDDNTTTELYTGMNDMRSCAFQMESQLWILDGKKMMRYDGKVAEPVEKTAYVPTSTIAAPPSGGGETKDQFNLLTPLRINKFLGNTSATVYQLDSTDISGVEKCEKLEANGNWSVIQSWSVEPKSGRVTFAGAIGNSPVTGEDNVRITYKKENQKENQADKINKCTTGVLWGLGGYNRLFVAGNPDYVNQDFVSDFTDGTQALPTYFPENMYAQVGQDNTKIIGYLRSGNELAILKEDNEQDATVFLRSATLKDDITVLFPLKTGLAGVGAVSPYCMKDLRDDHMYLSKQGVFAITTNAVTAQQYAQARSELINKKLCREPKLEEAVAVEYQGYLYIAVNGHVYVADAAQRNYKGKNAEQYQYEWYYWENVPARCWYKENERLLFGTDDGCVMRFYNTKISSSYNDDGKAITAYWMTPAIAFDTYTKYKTVRRIYTKLNPYARSSVKLYLKEDGAEVLVDDKKADIMNWDDVDFERFTFNTNTDVNIIYTKVKAKKIITTQFKFENDVLDEAFGIYGATVYYDLKTKVK